MFYMVICDVCVAVPVHGISPSSSLPPWSPSPPEARCRPGPANGSLPLPFDQGSPGNEAPKKKDIQTGMKTKEFRACEIACDFFTQYQIHLSR